MGLIRRRPFADRVRLAGHLASIFHASAPMIQVLPTVYKEKAYLLDDPRIKFLTR